MRKIITGVMTTTCLCNFLAANAYSSNQVNLPSEVIKQQEVNTELHKALMKKSRQLPKQMWNLQNADIRAVVQTISQLTGKNFIIDPRVQGKVTLVSARPMTVDEMYNVFLSMLQVLNYAAIPAGDTIKIIPSMDAKGYGGTLATSDNPGQGDQVVVRVVPINNVSAEQLVPILRPLMLDWGSVSAYQPSNSLVLSGSAANINQLVIIAHNLDKNNGSTPQVVHLKYADASKVSQVIQQLQSANLSQGKVNNVSIVADPAANALLVSGNAENRVRTVALIKQLDSPISAGGNNTLVIPLNYLTAKDVAPMLTKLAHGYVEQQKKNAASTSDAYGVGANANAEVSIQAIKDDNSIVMSGPHQVIQSLKTVLAKIDTRPQEVLVQAIIVKLDESTMSQLGVQWGSRSTMPSSSSGSSSPSTPGASVFQNGVGVINGLIPHTNLSAVISALQNNGHTDILATPSVLVLNNQKALLSDGKNVGILNRTYATGSTANPYDSSVPYNTVDRKDVTLSLNVTPQIAPDNTVKLVIKQKDDSLAQDASNQDPSNPTINTSKINTTVLVNSGDVLVLGGLISNNATQGDQKVPVLGDIPLLGQLFHYKTKNLEKKNLMIFIRPMIINNEKQGRHETIQQYNYIRYQQMRRADGLPASGNDYPILPYEKSKPTSLPPPFD